MKVKGNPFDFENHQVLLNSGYVMPIDGIGNYSLKRSDRYIGIR